MLELFAERDTLFDHRLTGSGWEQLEPGIAGLLKGPVWLLVSLQCTEMLQLDRREYVLLHLVFMIVKVCP